MAFSYPGTPSKLTLESGGYIYECINPSVTIQTGFGDRQMTIEARCWDMTTRLKENMKDSILGTLEEEVKAEKKSTKPSHPSVYGYCHCLTLVEHEEILTKEAKKSKKQKVKSRKDRFPKDGGKPIKASIPGYSKIPWSQGTLTLIAQSPDGQLHYAKTMEEKKQLAWGNFKWIVVCWPGKYTQDIFLIDDMTEFRKALGFKLVADTVSPVVTDEEGNEWIYDLLFGSPKAKAPTIPTVPKSYTPPLDYRYNDRF